MSPRKPASRIARCHGFAYTSKRVRLERSVPYQSRPPYPYLLVAGRTEYYFSGVWVLVTGRRFRSYESCYADSRERVLCFARNGGVGRNVLVRALCAALQSRRDSDAKHTDQKWVFRVALLEPPEATVRVDLENG